MAATMTGMRMFVAVVPPEEAVADLDEFLDVRREAAAFSWSAPEQWHLTLAFLADVRDRQLDDLVERLARAAAKRTTFALALAGGGAFPDPTNAKVLFSRFDQGDEGESELTRLATGARHAATGAGVKVDGARFRPHLTLARFGRPQEVTRWVRVLDAHRGPTWTVEEIALVQSHLGEGPRKRPRYETIATVPLRGVTEGRLG